MYLARSVGIVTPSERFRPRWYRGDGVRLPLDKGGMPVQRESAVRERDRLYLHPDVIRMAYAEYAAQGHGNQSLERLNERAGFGLLEVVMLLADALERECHS